MVSHLYLLFEVVDKVRINHDVCVWVHGVGLPPNVMLSRKRT